MQVISKLLKKTLFYSCLILFTLFPQMSFAEEVTITASKNIQVEKDRVFGSLQESNAEDSANWILFRYPSRQTFKELLVEQDPDFPAVKKLRLSTGEATSVELSLESHSKLQKIELPKNIESSWVKIEVVQSYSNDPADKAFGFSKLEPETKEEFKKTCLSCQFKKK